MGFRDSTTAANPEDGRSTFSFRPGEGPQMATEFARDQATDHLLTPRNAALVVIDYQPSQLQTVASIDHELLVDNIVSVARLAKTFDLPVVLSTVNVANGQGPTIPELKTVLSDSAEIDRTEINSWENVDFRRAVEATGREVDHDGPLDRGVPCLSVARCDARGI
jgi:hypothetical protein